MRLATRRSLKTVHGCRPALRPKLPSIASPPLGEAMGAESNLARTSASAKHGSWRKPVGETLEGYVANPQALVGVPEATAFGRPPLVTNWKLSKEPVVRLNGRPEATSIMGARVQSLRNRAAKPLPDRWPL